MSNKQDNYSISIDEDQQLRSGKTSTLNGLNGSYQKVEDAQTTENQDHDGEYAHTKNLTKSFVSRYQLHKILFENFMRWFFSAVVLLFIFATLKIYENKGSTDPSEKRAFNAIITGLQILLALNFFSALKDLARILRWRVLAEKPHSIHEVDLILSAESLTKLVRLWCGHVKDMFGEACRWSAKFRDTKYRSRPHLSELGQKHHDPAGPGSTPVRVSSKNDQSPKSGKIMRDLIWSLSKISAWLLINIIAQVAIAVISLTYSVDAGQPIQPAPNGDSYEPDLKYFYPVNFQEKPPATNASEQLSAHTLGEIGTLFTVHYTSDLNDPATNLSSASYTLFDGSYWIYRYFIYDAPDFGYTYSVPTSRTINVTWANCHQWPVIAGAGGNNSSQLVTYILSEDQNMTTTTMQRVDLTGPNTTTFIYPASRASCTTNNDRCVTMMAFQEPVENSSSFMYQCEITVGQVQNADPQRNQSIGDVQARYAAAAAGLSGFGSTDDHFKDDHNITNYQFQRYDRDSYWSLAGSDVNNAGQKMAEFSIASLAAMAENNPHFQSPGLTVKIGVILHVDWQYVRVLLPLIAGLHFIFFVVAVFAASPYVIHDDSNLANAQVLRPFMQELGDAGKGGYLTGKELAQRLDADVLKGQKVTYGVSKVPHGERTMDGDSYRVALAADNKPRRYGGLRFSDGFYE